jgi:N utilization substance protein B
MTGEAPPVQGRAARLVSGVLADLEGLDSRIEDVAEHWTVSRMPVIDRNILRLSLFELENDRDVPSAVVMSEAVRLASAYSTEKSAAFVNGVLSSLAKRSRA